MKCKTIVLWGLINDNVHSKAEESDRGVGPLVPIISALFPGLKTDNLGEFIPLLSEYVRPALTARFPDMLITPDEKIGAHDSTEIIEMLPCDGFEWRASREWRCKFYKRLKTA
jgi:hypothetical protein